MTLKFKIEYLSAIPKHLSVISKFGHVRHLKRLWVIMGEMCSTKMVQALKTWLKYYEDDDCDEIIREELLSMSSASIDRYLKSYKASLGRKKRTGIRPGKMFKELREIIRRQTVRLSCLIMPQFFLLDPPL